MGICSYVQERISAFVAISRCFENAKATNLRLWRCANIYLLAARLAQFPKCWFACLVTMAANSCLLPRMADSGIEWKIIRYPTMSPRLARLLDDLIANQLPDKFYTFVRDGHTDDLTHILNELEARISITPLSSALLRFTHRLLETRDPGGSDNIRARDRTSTSLKSHQPLNKAASTAARSRKGRGRPAD